MFCLRVSYCILGGKAAWKKVYSRLWEQLISACQVRNSLQFGHKVEPVGGVSFYCNKLVVAHVCISYRKQCCVIQHGAFCSEELLLFSLSALWEDNPFPAFNCVQKFIATEVKVCVYIEKYQHLSLLLSDMNRWFPLLWQLRSFCIFLRTSTLG